VLIVHGTLITLGKSDQLIEDGGLRITDEMITAVGPSEDLLRRFPGEETLHAAGMLVMPGLIDAHTHTHNIVFRGAAVPREEVPALWDSVPRGRDALLTYEVIRYATLAHCIEALRSGVTALFLEQMAAQTINLSLDAVAEPILQAGLRAMICYQVSDRLSLSHAREAVEENARFARQIQREKLLACSMGLDSCTSLSNDSLRAAVGTAAVVDIGFHVDVAARREHPRECLSRYGMRPVERLRKFGALGPRTAGVNCLYISPEETDLLHRSGASVIYTPRSNMLGYVGPAPISDMWQRGLVVGLGTDGVDSSLRAEMQVAYLLGRYGPGSPVTPRQVGQMALQHNPSLASRIFRARLGELAVGALADVVLVRYPSPTPLTRENMPLHFLWGHAGSTVDTVLVGGRTLLRHGELQTLDEYAILGHCRALARKAWAEA
jgi:cytosine/adenosine deaminase-related metal-dependent hydrolase